MQNISSGWKVGVLLPKFFISEDAARDSFLVLTGENAAHARVLRLHSGDDVTVCDGTGTDYRCTVSDVSDGQISLVVRDKAPSSSEPAVFCSVYMATALVSGPNDLVPEDFAQLCDAFYIGGTKDGLLFGEALVLVNDALKPFFRNVLKQRGGMGWISF